VNYRNRIRKLAEALAPPDDPPWGVQVDAEGRPLRLLYSGGREESPPPDFDLSALPYPVTLVSHEIDIDVVCGRKPGWTREQMRSLQRREEPCP
jgi:hypothetical protein